MFCTRFEEELLRLHVGVPVASLPVQHPDFRQGLILQLRPSEGTSEGRG